MKLVSGSEGAADVFHEQHQVQFVGGASLEFGHEVFVKVACLDRLRVDEQATATDVVGQFAEAREDVLKHAGGQADPLVVAGDAESR